MVIQLARRRFTTQEYHWMGEVGLLGEDDRVELIEGEQEMKSYVFRVVIEPDEDRWLARVPLLEQKGAATWAASMQCRHAVLSRV